jgi:hypothetical protein
VKTVSSLSGLVCHTELPPQDGSDVEEVTAKTDNRDKAYRVLGRTDRTQYEQSEQPTDIPPATEGYTEIKVDSTAYGYESDEGGEPISRTKTGDLSKASKVLGEDVSSLTTDNTKQSSTGPTKKSGWSKWSRK